MCRTRILYAYIYFFTFISSYHLLIFIKSKFKIEFFLERYFHTRIIPTIFNKIIEYYFNTLLI